MKTTLTTMTDRFFLFLLCAFLSLAAASCRSSSRQNVEPGGIPEYLEIEGCSLSVPCMIVTPETLDALPAPVREAAENHLGKPGTVVIVSGLRPRYLRLLRAQGLLLLGSVELDPSRDVVYLCILSGLDDAADSIRAIRVEDPAAPEPWNLGVFARRYPDLTARLNDLPPGDERHAAAVPAARELLERGTNRTVLEKRAGADPAALEDAVRAEREQIAVLEDILNSK